MRVVFYLFTLSLLATVNSYGQKTLFSAFKNPVGSADGYAEQGHYLEAIQLYLDALKRDENSADLHQKLARCYYAIKEYRQTVAHYASFIESAGKMVQEDYYRMAESFSVLGNYSEAEKYYAICMEVDPESELVMNKLWRIKNLHYLYEDSSHYTIRPLPFNSKFSDLCAVPYGNRLVFTSNRRQPGAANRVDASLTSYYRMYEVACQEDSTSGAFLFGSRPRVFASSLHSRFHTGPVAFYKSDTWMVYAATADKADEQGRRTSGLHFATLGKKGWEYVSEFPFNSFDHSIHAVAISNDGSRLYFSADMSGGFGGTDIYLSNWTGTTWSKPVNLGSSINTLKDESFPFAHEDGSLFFSSDGHPGLGGLDVFKSQPRGGSFSEPQNVGYPVNSSSDDFGIVFDTTLQHGYLSSNRMNGGYDDELYEFYMDLQTYPFDISGVIKVKEHAWSDSSEIKVWPNVEVVLVDGWQGHRVFQSKSDEHGNFSLTIPYFSKYYILVVDKSGQQHKASLEIQKYKSDTYVHEIVIVTNFFEENGKPD